MTILVDSCAYNCQNVGDLAMLTVAVSRLRELWPSASIQVITNAPDLVVRHCGVVGTVPVRGRRILVQEHLFGPLRRILPSSARSSLDRGEEWMRRRWPELFAGSARAKAAIRGNDARDVSLFLDAVKHADLVVVNGAGILTDAFKESALGILDTLDLAIRHGIPTALFGQGLGPIQDQQLAQRAAEVLPRVTQIAVRESSSGPALLFSLGVSPARTLVTGDDAIELAYPARVPVEPPMAQAIGINVRIAAYADLDRKVIGDLKRALFTASAQHAARLIPIPIAHHGGKMDIETLRELLDGLDDGGAALVTPRLVIDRVRECRVMVTGSYHGAVFALAQGIPVVALAKSEYYVNKMSGLAQEFGLGCEIIRLDREDFASRLIAAIDAAWKDADRVRGPLLAAAARQVDQSRAAYERLRDLMASSLLRNAVERLEAA
jgi:polysaccharide pyruvyl transferase WcaK-like protein